jgi:uncharacterized damage-inducible protein DinB
MHIRELLIDTTTHVPPARAIENLSAKEAMQRLSGASHSIAEILAHMVSWQEWFQRRCEGVGEPIPQKAVEGWPDVQSNTWPTLQSRFVVGLDAFVKMAESSDLDQKIAPALEALPLAHMTKRDAIIHVANHNAHHLGQIIIIRQMLGLWPPPSRGFTW